MNHIDALSKPPSVMARSPAMLLPPLPIHDRMPPDSPAVDDARGYQACLQMWDRVRRMPVHAWRALSRSRNQWGDAPAITALDALAGRVPYAAIALEIERALEHGTGATTALACMLLAAIALDRIDRIDRIDGGDEALALAQVALDLSARADGPEADCVRVLHAVLITARATGLDHAYDMLIGMSKETALPPAARLLLAGTAFAAGMPLTALSHHLDRMAHDQDASQLHLAARAALSLRVALLQTLSCKDSRPCVAELGVATPIRGQAGLDWLTRLQACWYAARQEDAIDASRRAAALIGPFTPFADLMCYHLFSALALSRSKEPDAAFGLDMHCLVLQRFACACPAGTAAIAELANAVRNRFAGNTLAALHGLERAGDTAARAGQDWVATLAAEEAALLAAHVGLDSAGAHYRQLALASCQRWGALGRLDMLKCRWADLPTTSAAEQRDESERLRRAVKAGEIGMSIAHEVNQPLAAITLHSAAARRWLLHQHPNVERALASLALISEAGRYAGEVVRGIQRLASHKENDMQSVAIDGAIREALRSLQRPVRKHRIEIALDLGLGRVDIRANLVQVQQVITNLLLNAIEALAGTGRSDQPRCIRIESRSAGCEEVEILIEDNGPGIAPSNRACIFGSMFTTKPGNTGLGLPISLAIVRAHEGRIAFEPREPHGARFRVCLPVRGPRSPVPAAML